MASSVIGNLRVALGLDSAAFQGGLRNASKQAEGFASTMRGLAASMAGAFSVGALAAAADQFTQMQNALRALEGDQAAVNRTMEELNAIAGRTRAPLDATVKLYQRMAISANELGVNQRDVFRFTENIGLALAQAGGSSQEAAGALFQLSQAMGGGIVRAEEFNSIVEGAYPIALAAAKGIEEAGGSVAKLRQIMLDGNLTSRKFFDGIMSQTDELEETFGRTMPTISQALGRLRDSFVMFIGQMDQGAGASGRVAQAILLLAENLRRVATYAATAAAGWAAYRVSLVAATVATGGLTAAMNVLNVALVRSGIGVLIVGAGELVHQFMMLTERAGGFGKAMGLLGDVANAVWGEIGQGGQALVHVLKGAAWAIAGSFIDAFRWIFDQWDNLINSMLSPFNSMLSGIGADFELKAANPISASLRDASANVQQWAADSFGAAATVYDGMTQTKTAIEALNVAVDATTGTTEALNTAMTGVGGAAEKGSSKAKKEISDLQRVMKELSDEVTRLKATWGMSDIDAEIWEKQREAGVTAQSANGRLIDQQMRQIDNMTELKDATEQWRDSIGSAMSEFITKGGSFKNVLASILTSLADIVISDAFNSMFRTSGASGWASSILGSFGIGSNANGTNNWRGGWSWVNERGGELMNLPNGTQIIPHDISKRMADNAGSGVAMTIEFTGDGNIRAIARDQAGRVIAEAAPAIQQGAVKQSVGAVRNLSGKSKTYFGGGL